MIEKTNNNNNISLLGLFLLILFTLDSDITGHDLLDEVIAWIARLN